MKQGDFKSALAFARQSKDFNLLNIVGHNGSIYYINNKNYAKAEKFAHYSSKKSELLKSIYHGQSIEKYNNKDYKGAISQLQRLGNQQELIKKCYYGLFVQEQDKLGKIKTADDVKQYRSTINNMKKYAKLSENSQLMKFANQYNKYL
jgi:hypothetical protein